ncbi:T6SS phospholipase effector Tle1-like catalytic domain-containing protein [Streptomyces leeuwenhoekii]|uniref:T6SS Phospholipase effector Tle1-like catalytic domain-containing protein n=1 Tax=Streptomyces leeuwenhoekii TaxID=1437453 RepID=A0A0F7VMJ3_STRLW|nr:DUF2235 domain-containing protein [Streptomyces leeuwenhoekii]CQR60565.1 Hypothetical [Streptomyces leeuwenhoekii]
MAKRLVVCCDGTWNFADQPSKTSVPKVALSLLPGTVGSMEQRVCYHSGLGTHGRQRVRTGAGRRVHRKPVPERRRRLPFPRPALRARRRALLFGFSRGAFTARSLAGLIRNGGILRRDHADRIPEAWAPYRDRIEQPNGATATLFHRSYARETDIRFIGVRDTVGALGIPMPRAAADPVTPRSGTSEK